MPWTQNFSPRLSSTEPKKESIFHQNDFLSYFSIGTVATIEFRLILAKFRPRWEPPNPLQKVAIEFYYIGASTERLGYVAGA